MKYLSLSKTKMITISAILFAAFVGSGVYQQNIFHQKAKLITVNNGIETCFQRVSQSFIALMTLDSKSNFLSNSFLQVTGECFAEVEEQFSQVANVALSQKMSSQLKAISSDFHWFDKKLVKLKKLISAQELNLSSSNIISKYSQLDEMKSNFFDNSLGTLETWKTRELLLRNISYGSIAALALMFLSFAFSSRRKEKRVAAIEAEASSLLKGDQVLANKVDAILDRAFSEFGMNHTMSLTSKYHTQLMDLGFSLQTPHHEKPTIVEKKSGTGLKSALDSSIDKLGSKILSYGTSLGGSFDGEIYVQGRNTDLYPIIFSTLNYAVDRCKNSSINVKTKVLGESVLLQVSLNGHCFNANELEFVNSREDDETRAVAISDDLLKLVQTTSETPFVVSLKNKIDASQGKTSAEIEFLFRVSSTAKEEVKEKEVKSIIRGKKKDILKQMNM